MNISLSASHTRAKCGALAGAMQPVAATARARSAEPARGEQERGSGQSRSRGDCLVYDVGRAGLCEPYLALGAQHVQVRCAGERLLHQLVVRGMEHHLESNARGGEHRRCGSVNRRYSVVCGIAHALAHQIMAAGVVHRPGFVPCRRHRRARESDGSGFAPSWS